MAMLFSGNRHLDMGGLLLPNVNATTIMIWFMLPDAQGSAMYMFSKTRTTNTGNNRFNGVLEFRSDDAVRSDMHIGNSNERNTYTIPSFSLLTWYHVATTYNGSSSILYVNGVDVGSTNASGSIRNRTDTDMQISGRDGSTTSRGFKGELRDGRIYDRALSEKEISQIYTSNGRDDIREGLYFQAMMNERGTGNVANNTSFDYSPNKFLIGSAGNASGTIEWSDDGQTFTRRAA